MKKLLSSLKLNAENFLQYSDLVNFRGGCNFQVCVNCVNTATGGYPGGEYGACGSSCTTPEQTEGSPAWNACYSGCTQNVAASCYQNFSTVNYGCYC